MKRKIVILILLIILISAFFRVDLFFQDRYDWHVDMGRRMSNHNMLYHAMQQANYAIELDYDRPEGHLIKGRILLILGRYEEAKSELSLHENKKNNYVLGVLEFEQGDNDKAMIHFNKCLSIDNTSARCYLGRSLVHIKNEEYNLAYTDLQSSSEYAEETAVKYYINDVYEKIFRDMDMQDNNHFFSIKKSRNNAYLDSFQLLPY